MKTPAWLIEFHRQWHEARGKKLQPAKRPFSRRWEELLDAAGLFGAAERSNAKSEAEDYQSDGYLTLRPHRYRHYLIESVSLPVSAEPWLLALFGGTSAQDLRQQAISVMGRFRGGGHSRWPESWRQMCDATLSDFVQGRNRPPFFWNNTLDLDAVMSTLHSLTSREWPAGTLIREASKSLGFDSKHLERKQRILESALHLMFGEETGLESLGLMGVQSRVTLHGPLNLCFADGTAQPFEHLRGEISIALSDLERCTHATTSAGRVLSIENAKTPFRRAVAANVHGDTLLIATSYPNSATRKLLELLPEELPHFHFGDTDASGYAILRSLREIGRRPVDRFRMDWRDDPSSPVLTEHDRRILPAMLASPLMEDCLPFLTAMENAGRKGAFEQEDLGPPGLTRWPFWQP